MEQTILEVFERVEGPKVLRRTGCIPGVLYGEGYEKGVPVAFEEANLAQIINKHGPNAKVTVNFNGNKTMGFIKELQKNNLTKKIIHSDIQVTSQNHKVRIKLPIIFNGVNELERRNLLLQIYNNHIEVSGEANILPEYLSVDVGNMHAHESIKLKDLGLDSRIKVYEDLEQIYAMIIEMKGYNDISTGTTESEGTVLH